jgi:hypothetical protein
MAPSHRIALRSKTQTLTSIGRPVYRSASYSCRFHPEDGDCIVSRTVRRTSIWACLNPESWNRPILP